MYQLIRCACVVACFQEIFSSQYFRQPARSVKTTAVQRLDFQRTMIRWPDFQNQAVEVRLYVTKSLDPSRHVSISLSVFTLLGLIAPLVGEPAVRGDSMSQAHRLQRAACTSDNFLRALQNAGNIASSFCSECISVPAKTVSTLYPYATSRV